MVVGREGGSGGNRGGRVPSLRTMGSEGGAIPQDLQKRGKLLSRDAEAQIGKGIGPRPHSLCL